MNKYSVCILISRVSKYLTVWESAVLLGGRRTDNQSFDEIGWWTRCLALEFDVPTELYERFERDLRKAYKDEITVSIIRAERAALPI